MFRWPPTWARSSPAGMLAIGACGHPVITIRIKTGPQRKGVNAAREKKPRAGGGSDAGLPRIGLWERIAVRPRCPCAVVGGS